MYPPNEMPGNLVNLGGDPRRMPMPTFGANPPLRMMPGQPPMPGQPMPPNFPGGGPWGGGPSPIGPIGPAQPVAGPTPTFGANPPRNIMPGVTGGNNLMNMGNYGDFLRRPVPGLR